MIVIGTQGLIFVFLIPVVEGCSKLRMHHNKHEFDDVCWGKGKVIGWEEKEVRKKKVFNLKILYSHNNAIWYIHRDSHNYTEKKRPGLGDQIDIQFSPTLIKALTREERRDAKINFAGGIVCIIVMIIAIGSRLLMKHPWSI